MDFNNRILKVIDDSGLNYAQFARQIGATRQAVSNWQTGNYNVPIKYAVKIIEVYPELDARWVLTGKEKVVIEDGENTNEVQGKVMEFEVRYYDVIEKNTELTKLLLAEKDAVAALHDELIKLLKDMLDIKT